MEGLDWVYGLGGKSEGGERERERERARERNSVDGTALEEQCQCMMLDEFICRRPGVNDYRMPTEAFPCTKYNTFYKKSIKQQHYPDT